jgi:ribosomal protein L4
MMALRAEWRSAGQKLAGQKLTGQNRTSNCKEAAE